MSAVIQDKFPYYFQNTPTSTHPLKDVSHVMKSKKYYISTAIIFSLGGKCHKELKIIELFVNNIII